MSETDNACLVTLGLIGLYRAGLSFPLARLREAAGVRDLATAIADGRLQQRGKLRRVYDYRVHGEHIVVFRSKFRLEFNFIHPEAFSSFLLKRHIELNRKLTRRFPQYIGLPLARHLKELCERKLVKQVDDVAGLFELTPEGEVRERGLRRSG